MDVWIKQFKKFHHMPKQTQTRTCTSPVEYWTPAELSGCWVSSRASIVNTYVLSGDRELTEPNTVFGPNVAKAMGSLGELWSATVILYDVAPVTLVHLRIMVLDVAVNTDTSIAVDTNEISEIINVAQPENLDYWTQKCVNIKKVLLLS